MRLIKAAPWYGEDRLALTHTGMIEMAAKLSLYLAYQVSRDNPGIAFEVMAMDDPLPRADRNLRIYFHQDGDEVIAYVVRWRSFVRGSVASLGRDFSDKLRAFAMSALKSKFPMQAAALKANSSVVTTRDRDWGQAVPPHLREEPDRPNGRPVLGMCAIYRNFEPWPEEVVERLSTGGLRMMEPNTQDSDSFDLDWRGRTPMDDEEDYLIEGFYTPAELFDDDGVFVHSENELMLAHSLVTRDPESPEDEYGVLGIDTDTLKMVGVWISGGDVDAEFVGEEDLRDALVDEEDPFPFKAEHIDAMKNAVAQAEKKGIDHASVRKIVQDIADRTTATIIWPSVKEVRSMIPRVSKLFRGRAS